MLKSLAVGALVSGPLGAVLQACGKSCEEKAEQAYTDCKGGCDTSGDECLKQCKNTYAGKLKDCGCVAVDINSTTPSSCDDPRTDESLLDRAHQNTKYKKIADYLTKKPGDLQPKEIRRRPCCKRTVFPYLRYGIMLGNSQHYPLPGRLYRHGTQFDFMISFKEHEPNAKELEAFRAILFEEVEASRALENMIYQSRKKDREHHTLFHRKLTVGDINS